MVQSSKMSDKVDEELRQSTEMLSTIYDLNPDAIVLTRGDNGKIIDCNKEYLNQIGYSREEVIGHTTLELNLYSSKVRNTYLEEFKKKNTVTNFELRIKRKDDIFINVLYSARLINVNGEKILLNIGKEITNRKKAADTIQQQAELIELSFDAIIVGQSDGIIESWNHGAEDLYGYSKTEAIGKPIYELLNTIFPVPWSRIFKEIYDGGFWEGELKHHTKNGRLVIVSSRIQLIKRDDGSLKLLETNRDITEHRTFEEHNRKLLENEQQLTEELQTSNEELQSTAEELQVSNEELHQQMDYVVEINQKLKQSEERLHALADNIPNLAWMAESDGWIFWYNKQWYEYTGTTLKEMQGWGWQKVHHPDYVESVTEEWSTRIKEGKPYDNIFPLKGKDGNYRWFLTRVTPIRDEQGKLIRWFGTNTDITERKLAEKELKASEERYHTLYSSMSEGVAIHEIVYNSNEDPIDYIIIDINPAYEKITGLNRIETMGMKASELYGTGTAPYIELYAHVAENGEPIEFETYFEPMNKHFKISVISPGKGKFATIFEDITKRKHAEIKINETKDNLELAVQKRTEELRSANRYNRSLIEASLDPLVTIGPDGKITDVNRSTEVVTGFTKNELIGTDFSDYFTEPEKARKGYQKVFNEGFVLDYPLEIKNMNGHITPVLYNASVYKNEFGEVIGVFAAARDITKIKKYEQNLKDYHDKLEEKVEKRTQELEKSNKELEQFAYITSHDLREPLRMITSFLQLLERRYYDQLDQDANDFIGFAVDGAKRLDNMTKDLLQYSRISSKQREATLVNFEHVLEEALINLKVAIEVNNAVITHDRLPTINGDEQLKVQLFQNIIGNAIKYRSSKNPKIHISAIKEKSNYIFSIKDNGIGMSPDHLERIFTIFQRLHTNEEYEGTGIGLAIAQKIVHQHAGEIWAESELGKGSTFYFTIPYQ